MMDTKNLSCRRKGVNGDETAAEEKGKAISLDKGEWSWKEKFVYPGRVEEAALRLRASMRNANRVILEALVE